MHYSYRPHDVELGYDPIWDRELEESRRIDDKVNAQENLFLDKVSDLFLEFGIDDFHKYNDFDFDYCLSKLKEMTRKNLER